MMNLYYSVRLDSLSSPVLKNVVTGQKDVNISSDDDTKWCFIWELNRSPLSCKSRAVPLRQHATHFTEFLANCESCARSVVVNADQIWIIFCHIFQQLLANAVDFHCHTEKPNAQHSCPSPTSAKRQNRWWRCDPSADNTQRHCHFNLCPDD